MKRMLKRVVDNIALTVTDASIIILALLAVALIGPVVFITVAIAGIGIVTLDIMGRGSMVQAIMGARP